MCISSADTRVNDGDPTRSDSFVDEACGDIAPSFSIDTGMGINDFDGSRDGSGDELELDREIFPLGFGLPVSGFGDSVRMTGLTASV